MSVDRQTSPAGVIAGAVRQMNPELREQYHAIRRLLSTTTAADLRARYRVGTAVLEIKRSEARYGARGVTLLATALCRNEATLYRYSAVAEAWSQTEVEEILLEKMPGGEPVSWCHLQEIAAAPPERRPTLLREALAKGLSLRELIALVREGRTEPDPPGEAAPRSLARLQQLTTACEAIERLAIDDALIERVFAANPERAGAIVGRTLAAQTKALRLLECNMVQLRKAAATLPAGPVPTPKAGDAPAAARQGFFPRLLSGGPR